MTISSHQDLHPTHGARFAFERRSAEPLVYEVTAFLPDGVTWSGELAWDASRARLRPAWGDAWALETVLKLARVLKRTGQPRLVRWRGRDAVHNG